MNASNAKQGMLVKGKVSGQTYRIDRVEIMPADWIARVPALIWVTPIAPLKFKYFPPNYCLSTTEVEPLSTDLDQSDKPAHHATVLP